MNHRALFSRTAALTAALALHASLARAQLPAPFVPDDPFFIPDIAGSVTQPGYYGQWHLLNQMPLSSINAGLDANLWGAWQRGLTGQGVVIGIVDNGTQGNHPDLIAKFLNDFSWDYGQDVADNNAQSYRGSPVDPDNSHGTPVAGVAAATGGNGLGMTGAAPFAGVASQRLLTEPSPPLGVSECMAEARAIGFQGQKNADGLFDPSLPFTGSVAPVRVMNHSYGEYEGYTKRPDWEMVPAALAASADLGVIHLYGAGNQRNEFTTQDSNTILNNTSPDVIVVAALGSNGKFSDYSSFGANVLVTAPSSSRDPLGQFSIATLDRTGRDGYNDLELLEKEGPDPYFSPVASGNLSDYSSRFGGTSSAAPLVSGIMALGVEANQNLDIRMARHLLAQTSIKVDPANADWITNAAGYDFNRNYGFGLIDADAFTLAATQVASMSPLTVFAGAEQSLAGQAFGPGQLTLSQSFNVSQSSPLPLEYVQVRITLGGLQSNSALYGAGIGAILGDISGTLLSPLGTSYQLFSNDSNLTGERAASRAYFESLDWTFTSYAYFGESINGDWTVTLVNSSANTNYTDFGVWNSYQMTFGLGEVTMVPEPSTYLLLILAGGIIIALRLSRTRRRS